MAQETAFEIARFGRFTLDARRRTLLADGQAVALHARAFDVLTFLIEHRHRAVPQAEILAHVWENRIVAENNLAVQLSSLRKALAAAGAPEPLIVTRSGQRYQFVGDLQEPDSPAALPQHTGGMADAPPVIAALPGHLASSHWRAWAFALAAIAMMPLAVAVWMARPGWPRPPHLSIAVLPFRNASADRTQDYLADAISDDLRADLGHIPASVVIARESAEAVRQETPQQIGAALNVRYLLSGTLVPEGDSYHVVSTLTDAGTGQQLWSAQFDPKRDRISHLRQSIVAQIASPLHVALDELESARSFNDRPDNPAAIDLFFRARSVLHGGATLKTFTASQALLQLAVERQPDFVEAKAALAWLLLRKVTLFDDPDDHDDFAKAEKLITQVLEASPGNAAGLVARAKLSQVKRDCPSARADATRVLTIAPSSLEALSVLGACDQADYRLDAAAADTEAMLALDPASPNVNLRHVTLGMIRLVQGRYQEAVDALTRGSSNVAEPSADLEPAEQAELMLIAATALVGHGDAAKTMYASYRQRFHNRTVWRISVYFHPSWRQHAEFWRALSGLENAGMPMFAEESDAALIGDSVCGLGDFASTPLQLPGGVVIDTAAFLELRRRNPRTVAIDIGRGVQTDASWIVYNALTAADDVLGFALAKAREHQDVPIVVVGDGVSGCLPYQASRHLIEHGIASVYWYRGGEEAWRKHTAAGTPSAMVALQPH